MYKTSLGSVTAEIEDLLAEKLSAKGRNLNQKLQSAGRKLPRDIRRKAAYLAEVEARCQNPKRAHEYDPEKVLEARKYCVEHLEKISRHAWRDRRRLAWFTSLLVNLFLLAVLFALAVVYLT